MKTAFRAWTGLKIGFQWYLRGLKDFSVFVCGTAVGAAAMFIALAAVLLGGIETVKAVAGIVG